MRYNDIGICVELYKNLLYKSKSDDDYYLDIPKPISDIEFALITDFIFGINIGISALAFTSKNEHEICPPNKTFDKLSVEDYRTVEYDLAIISFKLKLSQSQYIDSKFNKASHGNTYEMDNIVWRSIFGKSCINGAIIQIYGQCKVTKIDEFYRLKHWYENRINKLDPAREEFIDKITSLKALNKKLIKNNEKEIFYD